MAKNAGWRNLRPVIDATSCTGCLQCYLYCPDGTVYKVPSACQPTEPADAAASPAPDLAAMPKAAYRSTLRLRHPHDLGHRGNPR